MKLGQTTMKFGQCKFNQFTDMSIVLPRTLEVSLSMVSSRVRGGSSKYLHILAKWANYQWQPSLIIDWCLWIDNAELSAS